MDKQKILLGREFFSALGEFIKMRRGKNGQAIETGRFND